ncbi:hypothetical protein M885DRAFT_577434, partial [Pelagophyceae sp. CCMP2097]
MSTDGDIDQPEPSFISLGDSSDDDDDELDEAPPKNRGGRPRGAVAAERILIGEFASKAEAIEAGERATGTDTARANGGSWDYVGKCSRHVDCPVSFMVKAMDGAKERPGKVVNYTGTWGTFVRRRVFKHYAMQVCTAAHSGAKLEFTGRGVALKFRDLLSRIGKPFKKEQKAETIDSPAAIFGTCAGIMAETHEQLDAYKDIPSEHICLGVHSRKVDVVETYVEDGAEKTKETPKIAVDTIFSCYGLIDHLLQLHDLGHVVPYEVDGTYQLLEVGWALVVFMFTYREWVSKDQQVLDEAPYAKSFGQYYAGKFGGAGQLWHAAWNVTASGEGGVTAVSQNIESGNNAIKVLLGAAAMYSTVFNFVGRSLPKLMIEAIKLIP